MIIFIEKKKITAIDFISFLWYNVMVYSKKQ